MKANCYKCKHRREVFYSCHTHCVHPNPTSCNIKGHEHGIKNGWFFWPHNFDPVWLQNCEGFESEEATQ